MTLSLKKLLNTSSANAEVVDNHLILTLPEASQPVVWRMALDKIGTASFEIKQEKGSEKSKLVLKPKKGTAEIIASFDTKNQAVEALMITSKALQNAPKHQAQRKQTQEGSDKDGQPTTNVVYDTAPAPSNKTEGQKWLLAILGALIVIGLYLYLTSLIPERVIGFESVNTTTNSAIPPQDATGVPVSADDFLNGL